MVKYTVFTDRIARGGDKTGDISGRTISGEIISDNISDEELLEKIRIKESVPELGIIELENARRFRVLEKGFNELCSQPEDRYCNICSRFYLDRKEVPKAKHMGVKNTFYRSGRHNLCDRCYEEYAIK